MIKDIYEKFISNIILNGEGMKAFPLRSGTRQERLLSLFLFNIALKVLDRAIKPKKGNESHPDNKGKHKISIFADEMILYVQK